MNNPNILYWPLALIIIILLWPILKWLIIILLVLLALAFFKFSKNITIIRPANPSDSNYNRQHLEDNDVIDVQVKIKDKESER